MIIKRGSMIILSLILLTSYSIACTVKGDSNPCDSCIDNSEMLSSIGDFKKGNAMSVSEVISVIRLWKSDCTPVEVCFDGTRDGQCSVTTPRFCEAGTLIDKCQTCSCPPSAPDCQTDGSCGGIPISFNRKYSDEALSEDEMPNVNPDHPRLLLRVEPWRHGPSLEELRDWAQQEGDLKNYLEGNNPSGNVDAAFKYLMTGDESLVQPVVDAILSGSNAYNSALMYDWIYNSPSITSQQRTDIENKIAGLAQSAANQGEGYATIWSHYAYGPMLDLTAAALVLYGHHPDGAKYTSWAGGYLKKDFIEGWKLNDAAWQGGWDYYKYTHKLFTMIALWSSATDDDIYETEEDLIRNHLEYLIKTTYPNGHNFQSSGFTSYSGTGASTKADAVVKIAKAYNDSNAVKYFRFLDQRGWKIGTSEYLFYTPNLRDMQTADDYDLPLDKLWGHDGIGYLQWRTGFDPDDTIVEFICGDYFWSHKSNDQNSFYIYKNGLLANPGGIYNNYNSDYTLYYYRQTVASNSILIVNPDETTFHPGKGSNIPLYGGQRSCYYVPGLGSAETSFVLAKHLYRKYHEHHFETGDLERYEEGSNYQYAFGDATDAYNNPSYSYPGNSPKIDKFTREIAYLDRKYLVVFDRVNSLEPDYEKIWLLHSITEPQISSSHLSSVVPGHIELYEGGSTRIDNDGGTLYSITMFPENYETRKIGGTATISEVTSDPGNSGFATLIPERTNRFYRITPNLATDGAIIEDWTIELTDSENYNIIGSVTGNDGSGKISEDFISNSGRIFIQPDNWQATPQAGDKFSFSVIYLSYRNYVDGYFPPLDPNHYHQTIAWSNELHPGDWRIEVVPKEASLYDTFLHLLYPVNSASASEPNPGDVTSDNGKLIGLAIEGWIVMFPEKMPLDSAATYSCANSGTTKNLILSLEPNKAYSITESGSTEQVTASSEGIIYFTADCPTQIEVAP